MNSKQPGNVSKLRSATPIEEMAEKARNAQLVRTSSGDNALLIDGQVVEFVGSLSSLWASAIHHALRSSLKAEEPAPVPVRAVSPPVSDRTAEGFAKHSEYLTGPQVKSRYQISEMTLYRWRRDERLAFPKAVIVNRRTYFKKADLEAWEASKNNLTSPDPFRAPAKGPKDPESICASILAEYPGISWEDVIGKRRSGYLVSARHACIKAVYTARKDLSSTDLGKIFNKDHTSILYAVKDIV
ncbi:helix-turn-helix domain-containing protein [Sinorhizobium meliloti]|uniref:helix-turn-helix domain-containing protein n=1 Tax=Rhizobium meliloti TaxID=382 RepID=UPI000FDBB031|nr:helix-turn-helix domain-containing protein [Sinorhizobium meliloti]RVG08555.1 helix-turn-helix domain-containing protein [Sinorhizobium meliloti]